MDAAHQHKWPGAITGPRLSIMLAGGGLQRAVGRHGQDRGLRHRPPGHAARHGRDRAERLYQTDTVLHTPLGRPVEAASGGKP